MSDRETHGMRGRTAWPVTLGMITAVAFPVLIQTSSAATPATTRVSVDSAGEEAAAGHSQDPSSSSDGRFIAFQSSALDLVDLDANATSDIFVHDRESGTTELVSVRSDGVQANFGSYSPDISADGRFVVFESAATNLVEGDTNDAGDIYIHDRETGTTERVSVRSNGAQASGTSTFPSISADGRFVAFQSPAPNLVARDRNSAVDVFVRDLVADTTQRVTVRPDGRSSTIGGSFASVSATGRYIAFTSLAYDLTGGDTNGRYDVFVRDMRKLTTRRVSVHTNGSQGTGDSVAPSISADGRFVAFGSDSSNLIAGDTNRVSDVFVHDRSAHTTRRVSVRSTGAQGNQSSYSPSISANGRMIAFTSSATNLVGSDTNGVSDVFVYYRGTRTTQRVSVGSAGVQAEYLSNAPSISGDGCYVAFQTSSSNLVPDDTNLHTDVFSHGPLVC